MEARPTGRERNMDIIAIDIDPLVALLIIGFFSAHRFNTWPSPQNPALSGRPSDYINTGRFVVFYLLYAMSVGVLTLAFYGIPELLQIGLVRDALASVGIPPESRTLSIFSLIAIMVLNIPVVANNEKEWRRQLHNWARIPRDVDDLKKSLTRADRFMPTERHIELARLEIKKAGMSLQPQFKALETGWLAYLDGFQVEMGNNTVYWRFLRCLLLLIIARETCSTRILGGMSEAEQQVVLLGSRILSFDGEQRHAVVDDLDAMADYFIECICKQVIKNYAKPEERVQALRNLGFGVSHQDCVQLRFGRTFAYCLVGVGFCSLLSVAAIRLVLLMNGKIESFSVETFLTWSTGNFLSLCVALFVAAIIYTQMKHERAIDTISAVFVCLFVSTLASALYFIVVRDLGRNSVGNPLARIMLAMSFAALSPFVYRAITQTSFSGGEIRRFALLQGVVLGVAMMVLQYLVYVVFNIERIQLDSVSDYLGGSGGILVYMAIIGFAKGFFLGFYISYLIQKTKRAQLLKSLRVQPRATAEFSLRLIDGNNPVLARDVSRNGLKIEAVSNFQPGERIELESAVTGKIEGLIKWTQHRSRGRVLAGIFLSRDYPILNEYLRETYGAYYA